MAVNFPNSPNIGDQVTISGRIYEWDGEKWNEITQIAKSDVGLANVENYGIADQSEAQAGTSDEKYMTPLKTAQAISALESGLANVSYYTLSVAAVDWTGTEPTTAVKTVSGLLSTDRPLIDLDFTNVTFANVETVQTEYAKVYDVEATADDELTLYATEALTENIEITVQVVR